MWLNRKDVVAWSGWDGLDWARCKYSGRGKSGVRERE